MTISNNNEVCSPCTCMGSIKYIHVACLKEWIKSRGQIQCEICHSSYLDEWVDWAKENDYIKKEEEDKEEVMEDLLDVHYKKFIGMGVLIVMIFLMFFIIGCLKPN
mmetsp:Transcript_25139/g.24601  ORF Transcript_25139/g.24601 Transcript_25139/m.24601 type:complete len:106 (+) Transcript_25139:1029-1346(+)|eukprot:CAMPEP_0170551590 /NCGR_PEP_ID=MMETSP0211-20121228/9586_1 /TAXON_ID=311385 /ORGANISM="Pseudokeronopsis sp., Strain OXSARD2" /LENGTH=105 /DNA_ID=CAMNT_0010858849 /DNA_START=940 /DNA_END=1257 /DNA_ORIENTATION=+